MARRGPWGYVYSKMARRGPWGSRWLGLSHVVKDDLKLVLILLDGWEGCTWVRWRKEGTYAPRWLGGVHGVLDG